MHVHVPVPVHVHVHVHEHVNVRVHMRVHVHERRAESHPGGCCRAGIDLRCHRRHVRSVLASGWASGGQGCGPEGGSEVLGSAAGPREEMGLLARMSELSVECACIMGVVHGSGGCGWGAIQGSIWGWFHWAGAVGRVRARRSDWWKTGVASGAMRA